MGYKNLHAEYITDGSKLESVNEEQDLGVIIISEVVETMQCGCK